VGVDKTEFCPNLVPPPRPALIKGLETLKVIVKPYWSFYSQFFEQIYSLAYRDIELPGKSGERKFSLFKHQSG